MVHQLLSSSNSYPLSSPRRWSNDYDNKRICYRFPQTRDIATYVSGGLFAIGWWAFIDALIYNKLGKVEGITIGELITGGIATLGMLLATLIDKSIFNDDYFTYSRRVLWKARLFLFTGFTLMVSSLIGSVTLLIYKKYVSEDGQQFYFEIAVVVQNVCILMSSLILLIGQNSDNDAKYDFL